MKRAILIAITVMASWGTGTAVAADRELNVLLTGGPEPNVIGIKVSLDGRAYIIDSIAPLEAGGGICTHPEGNEMELSCEAAAIAGFEVNGGGGDDWVTVSEKIRIAVTLRGGPGDDRLFGGSGSDKVLGGAGEDALAGRGGADSLYGGPGEDSIWGGNGGDVLRGGPGEDELHGGPGLNVVSQM